MAAGVNAYLIKTDISKLNVTDMAHYVEDRIGNTITTAWNLNVKDVEQTISGVCNKVSLLDFGRLLCCTKHCTFGEEAGSQIASIYTCSEIAHADNKQCTNACFRFSFSRGTVQSALECMLGCRFVLAFCKEVCCSCVM